MIATHNHSMGNVEVPARRGRKLEGEYSCRVKRCASSLRAILKIIFPRDQFKRVLGPTNTQEQACSDIKPGHILHRQPRSQVVDSKEYTADATYSATVGEGEATALTLDLVVSSNGLHDPSIPSMENTREKRVRISLSWPARTPSFKQ